MRYTDASPGQRWRAAVASLLAFWVVVVAAEWALPGIEPAAPHAPHTLAASPAGHLAAIQVDHSHVSSGSTPVPPDIFAEAVLPRGTTALAAIGLIAAVAMLSALWRQQSLATIRGPPRRSALDTTGRGVLTRLCIARR